MTATANLRDLEDHAEDFRRRRGFTYTVLDSEGDVMGCVYIYPSRNQEVDTQVRSWVRADQREFDSTLEEALRAWLRDNWPFRSIDYRDRGYD